MSEYKFEAVIFDLDGVITKTALVHSAAWKKMFDDYLRDRSDKLNEPFVEFSHEKDYLPYVDGKPRYKGVESFLESRGIKLPFGDPEDDPESETICGLGNRKNVAFNEVLDRDGVQVYDTTVDLIHELKEKNIRVGVASSSKNCKAVLERAGLIDQVETRVDGVVSAELGLSGKPEPDIFTTAADNLGIAYDKAVVVEDAVSGVQAGNKGNFGLVLGIAREENNHELKVNGADIVVTDIGEIGFRGINEWFEKGLDEDNWMISYDDYFPEKEKTRETLLTVGNGYFGTRGALEETSAGEFNYPGTYFAGLYNRLVSKVGDRDIENEDFVNAPNWLSLKVRIDDGEWIEVNEQTILFIQRKLDFRSGVLSKRMIVDAGDSKEISIESERFASMADPHIAAMKYTVTPLNFSGKVGFRTGIDGNIINDGVARYRQLNQNHLTVTETSAENSNMNLVAETTQSKIKIAVSAKVEFYKNSSKDTERTDTLTDCNMAYIEHKFDLKEGDNAGFTKAVAMFTSQEWDSEDPLNDAEKAIDQIPDFQNLKDHSCQKWRSVWDEIDIKIKGDRLAQKLLRLHLYHLMASFSVHNKKIDASITARGLHGEAYRGHIFWDELFILPLYNLHFPEVTRSALLYRYRRLDEARRYAQQHGYQGAMFPWQSGSDGREETQVVHLNPVTGKWGPDFSSFQRHVSLAIAYNIWQYYSSSEDEDFMEKFGVEMFLEICRFWAAKATIDEESGRFSIKNVMGPDEFHEKYPGADEGGLANNTYTNIMVVWTLQKAFELIQQLEKEKINKVINKINLSDAELKKWEEITRKLNIIIENDILAQYEGYFKLKELDWEYYRKKYGNIYRMDRLLKAEGKSADDYKVAKQADTLQTFYNLNEEKVTGILEHLGYEMSGDYLAKNLEYYLARTSHGSTLSRVVHAQLANMINDKELSWKLYRNALTSDYADIQGGTTGEGIHAGVMAGTVLIAIQSFAGLDVRSETIKFDPNLPEHWRGMMFAFSHKGSRYKVDLTKERLTLHFKSEKNQHVDVLVNGKSITLENEKSKTITF